MRGRSAQAFRALAAAAAMALAGAAAAQDRAVAAGGTELWVVAPGAPGGVAEVRLGPGVMFPPLLSVPAGTRLRNLGCMQGLLEVWCRVGTLSGSPVEGFVARRLLTEAGSGRPPAGVGGDGGTGPDFFVVAGLAAGDRLNLRTQPTPSARILASLPAGERVRNLGCEMAEGARWCRVQRLDGSAINGWASAHFLREAAAPPAPRPPADGGDAGAGPDFWVVAGLPPGDRLNIRAAPSASARVLGTLAPGETVRNLGCESAGTARWCRIRSTVGADITGWVSGRYLREGAAPPQARPPAGGGDAGAGPDTWVVRGLPPGDRLNVRSRPSTQGGIVATLTEGERVMNLGCEQQGATRWCRVRTIGGVTGWAAARFLREG